MRLLVLFVWILIAVAVACTLGAKYIKAWLEKRRRLERLKRVHIPPKDEYFMDILYSVDYIFGGIKRDAKQREDKYNFDKKRIEIFDDKLTAIKQEWLYNTRKIIAPYSRICII